MGRIIKIWGVLLFAFAIAFVIKVDCIRSEMIAILIPDKSEVTDSIMVHFTHGYTVNIGCEFAKPTLGGYWGGHVEVEIDSFFYGHTFVNQPVQIVANKSTKNGRFEILNYATWTAETKGDMITSIVIPINKSQEDKLEVLLETYTFEAPYDYAFFGQRCSSFIALILSKAGIWKEMSELEAIAAFFYPRALRFSMLEFARHNQLTISTRKGADCRNWEGD